MKESGKKKIVIHDDHGYVAEAAAEDGPAKLAKAIRLFLESGADIISVCAATQEGICWYFPTRVGQVLGNTPSDRTPLAVAMRGLMAAGVDAFKLLVDEVSGHGLTMLAKLRTNDAHHVTYHPEFAGWFWLKHPEWRIGVIEKAAGGPPSFDYPCVGPVQRQCIETELRPHLLDYAVPEVREYRLSLVREFIERYDVAGLTLNFLRGPHGVSFPSRNAHHLTTFVAECRRIVVEAVGKRGRASPVVGAIVPWDMEFCRVVGLDVEAWIQDGLLDYVSPTETYVTDFNMVIEPWARLASSTSCAVYPGIIGLTSYQSDLCLPEEYGVKETEQGTSQVTRENIRALAHGFYAEGADGVSFFNFGSGSGYHPLPDICLPEAIEGQERHYIYLKRAPLFSESNFLQIELSAGTSERKAVPCRLHEDLGHAEATVRFKARRLADIRSLQVDVNEQVIPADKLSLIPHEGEGFIYAKFPLEDGMLCDGANEIGFALRDHAPAVTENVTVQEVEVRVLPK